MPERSLLDPVRRGTSAARRRRTDDEPVARACRGRHPPVPTLLGLSLDFRPEIRELEVDPKGTRAGEVEIAVLAAAPSASGSAPPTAIETSGIVAA